METTKAKQKERKIWHGDKPEKCEVCEGAIKEIFVDGRMKRGMWAMMCVTCVETSGVGVGPGKGQKYQLEKSSGDWVKVAG